MKYPKGTKKEYKTIKNYGNRGMNLESDINITNEYYLNNNIAVIHKKPTPITIAKVNYKSRVDAVIEEAYFKIPSTTDYNGIYKGRYIDFEAKETTNKNYFPLSNIHNHQIKHLINIRKHGGIGFIIVRFTTINETYLLEIEKLENFLNNETRKSIPLEYFKNNGYQLREKYNPRLNYLEIIDKILEVENCEKYY